jgi:hypothetical protein
MISSPTLPGYANSSLAGLSAPCGPPPRVAPDRRRAGLYGTGSCCPRGPQKTWPPASGRRLTSADVNLPPGFTRVITARPGAWRIPPRHPGPVHVPREPVSAHSPNIQVFRSIYPAGHQVQIADSCEGSFRRRGGEVAEEPKAPAGQTHHCAGGAPLGGPSPPGSCGGSYHTDRHPGSRQATAKCPQMARSGCSVWAPGHQHRSHDTSTRPGPHSCWFSHRSG